MTAFKREHIIIDNNDDDDNFKNNILKRTIIVGIRIVRVYTHRAHIMRIIYHVYYYMSLRNPNPGCGGGARTRLK